MRRKVIFYYYSPNNTSLKAGMNIYVCIYIYMYIYISYRAILHIEVTIFYKYSNVVHLNGAGYAVSFSH